MILLLSVRLLDGRYHGLTANGEKPEWPPSPFRLFQALVAGNARGTTLQPEVAEALRWLESLNAPDVIAPNAESGQTVLAYVLNNTDGRSRTPKMIRPTILKGDRLIQYAWKFDPNSKDAIRHADVVAKAARHIRALGWGIDMAIGNGEIVDAIQPTTHPRIRFFPAKDADVVGADFRSPGIGSLASLEECYSQYLARFESNETTQLESGAPIYQLQPYLTREVRPHAVFKLLDTNEDPYRYPHAKLIHIAGMVRHLAIEMMKNDPPPWVENPADWVNRAVRGKRDEASSDDHKQFSYVPLPSIGHEHADAMIRNVMVVAPLGMERELNYLVERLDGVEMKPEGYAEACETDSTPSVSGRAELQEFTPLRGKFIATRYLGTSSVWETVTPVILDGCNRKSKSDKPEAIARATEKLICKALGRAGIEAPCEFTWQSIPFVKNTLSAHKYDGHGSRTGYYRPSYLQGRTAVHVRIRFGRRQLSDDPESAWIPANVPGPVMIGAGRHCGFGIFAAPPNRP